MNPGLGTTLWWLAFGGTHIVLSLRSIRSWLIDKLGLNGFISAYSLLAAGTFSGLVLYVAEHRLDGDGGMLFASLPPVEGALVLLSTFGLTLIVAGVIRYPSSPMALFRQRAVEPRGIQQISRHPFFAGVALWAGAHVLLSSTPAACAFFAGFVVLAVVGGVHQDRRLAAELGDGYREYLSATSFVPFAALLLGKQRIRTKEQPWLGYAIGLAVALALREVHAHIFDYGGAWIIATVLVGAVLATVGSRRLAKKKARRAAAA